MYFSHICHFRPMTRPNPLKTQIFDPFPTQPNPTQPNPRVNPTHGQLWLTLSSYFTHALHMFVFFIFLFVISCLAVYSVLPGCDDIMAA